MQPVIAELVARAPSSSISSTEGYGSVTDELSVTMTPSFHHNNSNHGSSNNRNPMTFSMTQNSKINDDLYGSMRPLHSRQESYLTSSGASTASTLERGSLDVHQRMFRAVDGRVIHSPRHSTRKSKAYGNMLKEDVGGTLRAGKGGGDAGDGYHVDGMPQVSDVFIIKMAEMALYIFSKF